jgi:type I restriction enzyme S subunit
VQAARYELKSIAEIQYGFTAKASADPVGPKFLRITDIQDGKVDWSSVPFCEAEEGEITKFRLSPGEIVFARTGATTGKSYLIKDDVDAVFASYLIRVKPAGGRALPDYLAYYFQTEDYWDRIAEGTEGAAQGGFNASKLGRLEVPLPPLEEQKRIVAVLDQAFAALDRARAHTEANLADADALFAAALNRRFEILSARTRPLIDLCSDRGITYGVIKLGDHLDDGVPCLRTSNVKPLNIDVDGMKRIASKLSEEYSRTILNGGEVLVNVRGTLGGVAVVPPEMSGWNVSREVAMVDIKGANPFFVAYFISTTAAQAWLTGVTKGAAYKGINLSDLRRLMIPTPDSDEQALIVQELDALRSDAIRLKADYAKKLTNTVALRECLLHQAFSGQLTA